MSQLFHYHGKTAELNNLQEVFFFPFPPTHDIKSFSSWSLGPFALGLVVSGDSKSQRGRQLVLSFYRVIELRD